MRKLLIAFVIGVIAWQAWVAYQTRTADEELLDDSEASVTAQLLDQEAASDRRSPYQCDGCEQALKFDQDLCPAGVED